VHVFKTKEKRQRPLKDIHIVNSGRLTFQSAEYVTRHSFRKQRSVKHNSEINLW